VSPRFIAYDAGDWGVGELWLDGETVVAAGLPRPGKRVQNEHPLAARLARFFAGQDEPFADVELLIEGTEFDQALARAMRAIPRGEVVTYGELALLAGRARAARAAGTFCARCNLAPFLPVHRVVSVNGIGGFGDLGVDYKRRMLALENVTL
jgi:methylated-DNA-[protein]-cysteine S-methyltransferase